MAKERTRKSNSSCQISAQSSQTLALFLDLGQLTLAPRLIYMDNLRLPSRSSISNTRSDSNDSPTQVKHETNSSPINILLHVVKSKLLNSAKDHLRLSRSRRPWLRGLKSRLERLDPSQLEEPQRSNYFGLLAVLNEHLGGFR